MQMKQDKCDQGRQGLYEQYFATDGDAAVYTGNDHACEKKYLEVKANVTPLDQSDDQSDGQKTII